MTNFIQNVSCCLARILRSEIMLLCNLLQEKGTNLEEGIWTKKFLNFWGLWQDTICLMRYSCQTLFPPSTRATLKSFGDVFAQSCCQCRCKWDGTLGTASADFQVFRHPRKHWIFKRQRICRHKRKECWFKTQIVWEVPAQRFEKFLKTNSSLYQMVADKLMKYFVQEAEIILLGTKMSAKKYLQGCHLSAFCLLHCQ